MKKFLIIAIAIFSLFFFTQDASACGRRFFGGRSCGFSSCSPCFTSCSPICSTPVCSTPIVTTYNPVVAVPVQVPFAYPILVPAFQFQYVPPTYVAPTIPVVPATAYPGYPGTYPAVPPPPIAYGTQQSYGYPGYNPQQPMGYGQPPSAYGQPYGQPYPQQPPQYQNPQQNQQDKIRELARALLEEMNRQSNDQPQDNGPPAIPGLGQPSQPYNPPQPYNPQPSQPSQPNPQQYQQVALTAVSRNCAACHTGVGSKKGVQIFTQPGLVNQNVNWRRVKEEIDRGSMPPSDSQYRLAPQEKDAILKWLSAIGVN